MATDMDMVKLGNTLDAYLLRLEKKNTIQSPQEIERMERMKRCRKTKIVCTLGPRSRDVPILETLLKTGMNIARFNFSHGSHEYHKQTLDNLRQACQNTQIMCAVMLDTKGPEIRTGLLEDGKPVQLTQGQELIITNDYSFKGNTNKIGMSYKSLPTAVKPGSTILCSDGTITLTVLECDVPNGLVKCRVENTTKLGEKKNVNLPGVIVDLPTITEKDIDDILNWGIPNNIDFIAASFVRKGSDVRTIKNLLGQHAKTIHIISKIENQEGMQNFDDILAETDGIMVARGDLGMEIPIEKIFLAQKLMIYKCNAAGKPVVTATQMLESMVKSPKPTRAEATDVANAVVDGTDAVMLSGETANGAWPEDAVRVMAQLCVEAEDCLDYGHFFKQGKQRFRVVDFSPLESLASAAVRAAWSVKAALIMVLSQTGGTAKLVAKYRPSMPIISVVVPVIKTNNLTWSFSDDCPYRLSLVSRGIIPVLAQASCFGKETDTSDEIINNTIEHMVLRGFCKRGETIVALHRIGTSSAIKVVEIKDPNNLPRPASAQ